MNTTRRLGIGALAFILMTQAGLTQTPLAFEVASVKRNPDTGGASSGVQIRPDQLEAIWIPAQGLIHSGVRRVGGTCDRHAGLGQNRAL
jgi:hypothetical protein